MPDKNSFAVDPPMGWNSWDVYGAAVNEAQLMGNAEYMAEHLKEYGWEYVVCDIEWYSPTAHDSHYENFAELCMDEYGRLIPAPNRFPSAADGKGFKPIADRIHAMGLKFGIHIMRGIPRQAIHENCRILGTDVTARKIADPASVCCWNPDMYGVDISKPGAQEYYNSILDLYASWGVDFIKVDDICVRYAVPNDERTLSYGADEVEMLRRAIDQCGRDIVLSLSPGPAMLEKAEHLEKNANMWRISNDFWDEWGPLCDMFERCKNWAPYVKDGCFPDCDMLPLGHISIIGCEHGLGERQTRFTHDEQQTMLSLWSIFRSPLMIGSELTDLANDPWTTSLLTNKDVVTLGKHSRNAHEVRRTGMNVVWVADDKDDACKYAAMFNTIGWTENFVLSADDLGIEGQWRLIDLWTGEEDSILDGRKTVTLRAHASKLWRLEKI